MDTINFYTVIIGTELLNGRRVDSHFPFVNAELTKRGWEQKASFIIDDDPEFMKKIYSFIKEDPHSVLFSFGGIGATPDDHTREVSAEVFTGKALKTHKEALEMIEKSFYSRFSKEDAEFKLIQSGRAMAELPVSSSLLDNPINKVPGYSIGNRFFFVPGFPAMAKPMIIEVLDTHFKQGQKKFRETITVQAGESSLIDIMEKIPKHISSSCLPSLQLKTIFSLSCYDEKELSKWMNYTKEKLSKMGILVSEGE